jgi:hypothetical protein
LAVLAELIVPSPLSVHRLAPAVTS